MKGRLISVTAFFAIVLLVITGMLWMSARKAESEDYHAGQIVAINELEQLAQSGELDEMATKAELLKEDIRATQMATNSSNRLFLLCGICMVFLIVVFGYVYVAILRPFDKMKAFAQKISQGDFEVPLDYERSNYFGDFTWAFDSMRREITKARSCEREAIENNKTVIATLSHDIKTPIASIRAYAEGLEANLDATPEKREKYLSVIMKKCDEVSRLTNDLFLHSLSDLEKLKISLEETEICGFVENVITELSAEQNDLIFAKPDFTAKVLADRNRLTQILENLVNNARKYAKSRIEVTLMEEAGNVRIRVRDYGQGIPDEDMPFIFDKFYRGRNCGSEQGSGLGLYIVKYIAKQMHGNVLLHNHSDGLEAVITLPIIAPEQ